MAIQNVKSALHFVNHEKCEGFRSGKKVRRARWDWMDMALNVMQCDWLENCERLTISSSSKNGMMMPKNEGTLRSRGAGSERRQAAQPSRTALYY